MARVSVFLSSELLAAIDEAAAAARINRSALVQTALVRHLEALQKEREETEMRLEMAEACRGMDALARKLGKWDAVKLIRESRGAR